MTQRFSRQEVADLLRGLATPIDFDDLIAKGVLKKSGAWYTLLKPKDLPPYAWQQAFTAATGPNSTIKLKFRKSTKKAEALLKRISGYSPQGRQDHS